MIVLYIAVVDAFKAFDRVHYGKLFRILMSKNSPKIVVRLYFDSSMRRKACVLGIILTHHIFLCLMG